MFCLSEHKHVCRSISRSLNASLGHFSTYKNLYFCPKTKKNLAAGIPSIFGISDQINFIRRNAALDFF